MFWSILLLIITVYIIYRFLTFSAKHQYPPGPRGLPVVGNIFNVDTSRAHASFAKLAKEYGGIFSLNLFGKKVVVINKPEIIREALKTDTDGQLFGSRPKTFLSTYSILGQTTMHMAADENWKSRRQLMMKRLNAYSDGFHLSETALKQEIRWMTEWIARHKEQPLNLDPLLLESLVNNTAVLLLGKRFEHGGEALSAACEFIKLWEKLSSTRADMWLTLFPFLRKLPFWYGRTFKTFNQSMNKFLKEFHQVPKENYKPGVTRGLLDVLLKTQEDNNNQEGLTGLTDEEIQAVVCGLLLTSVAKIHTTLVHFFHIILHKPAVALRIQREVEKVTGSNRLPTVKDKSRMPYTEATILELLRFTSHTPMARNVTTNEVKLEEYHIPANTTIISNLWAVHHDERLWKDPMKFQPERFLDDKGRLLTGNCPERNNLMAFGVGGRRCVGEGFAISRIFLYMTTLLQQYNFRRTEGETTPPADPLLYSGGCQLKPGEYRLRVYQHPYKVDFYKLDKCYS